jgi:crotonobetainyl-CoA:carnitine CoA-transferase CaiB-like acyl-CoA transferase
VANGCVRQGEVLARARFLEGKTADWLEVLATAGVPVGKVNDVEEALADKQVQAREAVVGYQHLRLGYVRQPASALRIEGYAPSYHPAPTRGEATRELLTELCGYDDVRLQQAQRAGAFGAFNVESD